MRTFFPAAAPALALLALLPTRQGDHAPAPSDATRPATAEGTLIVLNKSGASATFVDVATGETLRTLDTGAGPHEGAVSPDGALAVVANYGTSRRGDSLTVYDLATGESRGRIRLGEYQRPHGLWFVDERRVLVTAEVQKALIEVDLEAGEVVRAWPTDQEASHMVAATPDGTVAFVANIGSGSCTRIELATGATRSVPTGAGAEGVDVSPDGKEVWVSNRAADSVTVLDAATLEVLATIPCEGFPIRVKLTPDGTRALVSCPMKSDVAVFDVATREPLGRVPMELEFVEGAEERLFGARFGRSAQPIGVLVHPDGKVAFVACAAADRVAVVDLATLTVTRSFATGEEPDGLAFYR